jgi:hypothetical protein
MENVFQNIFNTNGWTSDESISGPGSTLEQTKIIREEILNLIDKFKIKSIMDAPCGDLNWMKHLFKNESMNDVKYFGVDIIPDIIENNIKRYSSSNISFKKMNICEDVLPKCDLILCRDCLVHFNTTSILNTIKNFKKSQSTYLLTTTFSNRRNNKNLQTGSWQPLNLRAEPFNFPAPILSIIERCTENNGIYSDKSLALWSLNGLNV